MDGLVALIALVTVVVVFVGGALVLHLTRDDLGEWLMAVIATQLMALLDLVGRRRRPT